MIQDSKAEPKGDKKMTRKAKDCTIPFTIQQAMEIGKENDKMRGALNNAVLRDWYFRSSDCFGKNFTRRSATCREHCGVNLLCEFYHFCKDEHRKQWGF